MKKYARTLYYFDVMKATESQHALWEINLKQTLRNIDEVNHLGPHIITPVPYKWSSAIEGALMHEVQRLLTDQEGGLCVLIKSQHHISASFFASFMWDSFVAHLVLGLIHQNVLNNFSQSIIQIFYIV